jgi:hypothetical protein
MIVNELSEIFFHCEDGEGCGVRAGSVVATSLLSYLKPPFSGGFNLSSVADIDTLDVRLPLGYTTRLGQRWPDILIHDPGEYPSGQRGLTVNQVA